MSNDLTHAPLGQKTAYPTHYDRHLLYPIARALGRSTLALPPHWIGMDEWTAFEMSWLNRRGKPIVAMARFQFPATSPYIIESKSFKLYLNSFNHERFESIEEVKSILEKDLQNASGSTVDIDLLPSHAWSTLMPHSEPLPSTLLDDLDVTLHDYTPNPLLLQTTGEHTTKMTHHYSHLLKTNCPVTGQPDWGTFFIAYQGPCIAPASLLAYLVSFRNHNGFHEQCVEQIYVDILQQCHPTQLWVGARYTRRGGLDINPWRASDANMAQNMTTFFHRLVRQ